MIKDIDDENVDIQDNGDLFTPDFEDVDMEFPENEDITPIAETQADETSKLNNKWVTIISSALVGVAVLAIIIAGAVKSGNARKDSDGGDVTLVDKSSTYISEEDTTESETGTKSSSETKETETFTQSPDGVTKLDNEDYPEIADLIEDYYAAIMNADFTSLSKLIYFDGGETLDENDVKLRAEILEGVNISKYYIYYGGPDTYIVYVSYGLKFVNVSTTAPALTRFCVVYKDGRYDIYNGTISDEVQKYITAVENSDDIMKISNSINISLAEARKKDGKLNALLSLLKVTNETISAETTTEETTAAETTKTETSEEETTEEATTVAETTTEAETTTSETTASAE